MSNIKKGTREISKSPSGSWVVDAKFRVENRKWLRYSNKIALRILAAMESNGDLTQKKLAEMADVSPQQVCKILKGHENLTLQSIAKFSEILGVELIKFPDFKYSVINHINFRSSHSEHIVVTIQNQNHLQCIVFPGEITTLNFVSQTPTFDTSFIEADE